jgi:hypothetical protein
MHEQHSVVYVVMVQEAIKYKLIKIKGESTCHLVNSYILTLTSCKPLQPLFCSYILILNLMQTIATSFLCLHPYHEPHANHCSQFPVSTSLY